MSETVGKSFQKPDTTQKSGCHAILAGTTTDSQNSHAESFGSGLKKKIKNAYRKWSTRETEVLPLYIPTENPRRNSPRSRAQMKKIIFRVMIGFGVTLMAVFGFVCLIHMHQGVAQGPRGLMSYAYGWESWEEQKKTYSGTLVTLKGLKKTEGKFTFSGSSRVEFTADGDKFMNIWDQERNENDGYKYEPVKTKCKGDNITISGYNRKIVIKNDGKGQRFAGSLMYKEVENAITKCTEENCKELETMLKKCTGAVIKGSYEAGKTALHLAAQGGYLEAVDKLLDNDADAQAEGNNGLTPLHLAANKKVCTLLLDAGAEVDAERADGRTALHDAVQGKRYYVAKKLLDADADVNAKTHSDHNTPLHLAVLSRCNSDMIALLLKNGSWTDAVNNGMYATAEKLSKSRNHSAYLEGVEKFEKLKMNEELKMKEQEANELNGPLPEATTD